MGSFNEYCTKCGYQMSASGICTNCNPEVFAAKSNASFDIFPQSFGRQVPPQSVHVDPRDTSYDIFLSYRRDGGETMAILLRDRLVAKGYRVFLDIENLNSGRFNAKLLTVIENCTDFVSVLSKNSLDRCANEGDWVRLEIAHAIATKKNIVPVMLRGFEWPQNLPDDISELTTNNGINASMNEYFDAAIDRLTDKFLLSKPVTSDSPPAPRPDYSPPLPPITGAKSSIKKTLAIAGVAGAAILAIVLTVIFIFTGSGPQPETGMQLGYSANRDTSEGDIEGSYTPTDVFPDPDPSPQPEVEVQKNRPSASGIVGRWEGVDSYDDNIAVVFHSNGLFEYIELDYIDSDLDLGFDVYLYGQYTVSGNIVTITYDNGDYKEFLFSVTGNVITLGDDIILTRGFGSAAELLGEWELMSGDVIYFFWRSSDIEFFSDGRVAVYENEEFGIWYPTGELTFSVESASGALFTYRYTLSGDTLIIWDEDGDKAEYRRL